MRFELNSDLYPAIFEAHVGAHRRHIDELRAEAECRGQPFDPLEHEQVLVGIRQDNLQPAWVPLRTFLEHGLIIGRPGSGKTALLASILVQLIRSRACSVVVVGNKIEPALFQGAVEECYFARQLIRWLTNRNGLESFGCNMLSQSHIPWRSVNQRVQPLLKALGLEHGEQYGASWFSSNMETFLNNIITYYGGSIYSFLDLAYYCADPNLYTRGEQRLGTMDEWSNSRHLHHEIFRLAGFEPGNVKSGSKDHPPEVFENAIDVAQLFSEPQVLYLHMSSISEDTTTRNIIKLLFYASLEVSDILATARQRGEDFQSYPVMFIFDEYAPFVSETFLPAIAQARALGLGCLMGLQTLHQLGLGDKDYTNTFLAQTAYKHILSAPDLFTQRYVVDSSGETERPSMTWRQQIPKGPDEIPPSLLSPRHGMPNHLPFMPPEVNVQLQRGPKLLPNDVMRHSAERFGSFYSTAENYNGASDNGGWVPLYTCYHIDRRTYERRKHEPFPSGTPGTILVRPFSQRDLRYYKPQRSLPPAAAKPQLGGPVPALEVVRRIRGE